MKEEKEVLWIVNLLKSKYVKRKFRAFTGGCKKDFERVARASENNKDFLNWFDSLLEEGIFESFEERIVGKGRIVNTYVIDGFKLYKKLKNIEMAKSLLEMGADKESVLF